MADEFDFRASLQVKNGSNLIFQSQPANGFRYSAVGTLKGPSPGAITVPITGVRIVFSELTLPGPGPCWIYNDDATNFVTLGIYDNARFYPLLEFPPKMGYPVFLSRYLNQEFVGTGTGTNADINQFMLFADTAPCNVFVGAFNR